MVRYCLHSSAKLLWVCLLGSALFFSALLSVNAQTAAPKKPLPKLVGSLGSPEMWSLYKEQFVKPDGRVIDNVNGSISHSESQGYGMVLAVAANDRKGFDQIWSFTKERFFVRKDGLAAWLFTPSEDGTSGQITDMNNATDGDLLIAWALAEAANAGFGDEYMIHAIDIVKAMEPLFIADKKFGVLMAPGAQGFSAEERGGYPVVNLSYWVFPAFDRLEILLPRPVWGALHRSGQRILPLAVRNKARLPADWTALDLATRRAAAAPGFAKEYSYNNIRIPLYLAWSSNAHNGLLKAAFEHWMTRRGALVTVNVATNQPVDTLSDFGYAAIRALYLCATRNQKIPPTLFTNLDVNYYPATLQLLSIVAVKQRFPSCV